MTRMGTGWALWAGLWPAASPEQRFSTHLVPSASVSLLCLCLSVSPPPAPLLSPTKKNLSPTQIGPVGLLDDLQMLAREGAEHGHLGSPLLVA